MTQEKPEVKIELCELCGHNFDNHLIKGCGELPLEGWMECPVDRCECSRTWSVDKTRREEYEKYKVDRGLA